MSSHFASNTTVRTLLASNSAFFSAFIHSTCTSFFCKEPSWYSLWACNYTCNTCNTCVSITLATPSMMPIESNSQTPTQSPRPIHPGAQAERCEEGLSTCTWLHTLPLKNLLKHRMFRCTLPVRLLISACSTTEYKEGSAQHKKLHSHALQLVDSR